MVSIEPHLADPRCPAAGVVPRLLLVSNMVPAPRGTTGQFLHMLCRSYPADRLAVHVLGSGIATWPADLERVPHVVTARPPEDGVRRWGPWLGGLTRALAEMHVDRFAMADVVRRVARFAVANQAEALCIPLNRPSLIRLAARLAGELRLPLYTVVWEPAQYKLALFGLRGAAMRRLLRHFDAALTASTACAVISEEMGDAYRGRYGVRTVRLVHAAARELWQEPAVGTHRPDRLTIGYAGNLYALDAWNALLDALRRAEWRIDGREVRIRVLSDRWSPERGDPTHVEYLGWRPAVEAMQLFAPVDVCYLPYWFDDQHAEVVRLAFPSKISFYLASGRPILYHGPEHSSPIGFFRRFPCAVTCTSLRADDVVTALRTAADAETFSRLTREAGRARAAVCSPSAFRQSLAELLGVEAELLATA
jgi:hypothetical protein